MNSIMSLARKSNSTGTGGPKKLWRDKLLQKTCERIVLIKFYLNHGLKLKCFIVSILSSRLVQLIRFVISPNPADWVIFLNYFIPSCVFSNLFIFAVIQPKKPRSAGANFVFIVFFFFLTNLVGSCRVGAVVISYQQYLAIDFRSIRKVSHAQLCLIFIHEIKGQRKCRSAITFPHLKLWFWTLWTFCELDMQSLSCKS